MTIKNRNIRSEPTNLMDFDSSGVKLSSKGLDRLLSKKDTFLLNEKNANRKNL